MRKLFFLIACLPLLMACSKQKGYETVNSVDANGYKYETVTNDPYNARIYTLDNGLKIYLSQNKDEPRIQTLIAVKVGAKDDPRDNTGLAHYLEHMMFKGTNHFGTADWDKEKPLLDSVIALFELHKLAQTAEEKKEIYKKIDETSQAASQYAISNEYDKLVSAIGASGTNAFTSYDLTAYINEIPSNELDKFMKLEYDRFSNLVLRLFHTELETVYEEFNMYQDMGNSLVFEKALGALFEKHPYKVPVIGLPEHLKKPSMKSVMEFQKTYYVPNNMAVCMSGDLDFDETVKIIDKYFGKMEPNNNLPKAEVAKEDPVKGIMKRDVYTPDAELMLTAYRSSGAKSEDAKYLNMIASILYNGKAGLIDLDIIQKQQALWMGASAEMLKDYGIFYIYGAPREGQSLEDLGALIQVEIDKVKKGDFDNDLLEAIINNKKLDVIKKTDSRGTSFDFLDAFIQEIDWKDYISEIDEMSKLTKEDIVKFANEFFGDNYVTVFKHTGENKDKVVVDKPEITAIKINRDVESEFAKELLAEKVQPIEPVFIDFKEKIKQEQIKEGIDLYYTKNESNKIYQLNHFAEIGSATDKKLALAFKYLPYLGTSKYSPEALKMEMYKLGMSFNVYPSSDYAYVMLSGLDETLDRSISLMEEILSDPVANEEAYENMVNDILKDRANDKLNKGIILRGGLVNYTKFGEKSRFTDLLSESELKSIKPEELINLVKDFSSYKHGFYYYGPKDNKDILASLKKIKSPESLKDVPQEIRYPELPMDKPVVYFTDYDMVQAEIIFLAKGGKFDPAILPYQSMFNSYYGSGMNSIIFQEIREARGLAYSAYAYCARPGKPDESNYIQAYVGTQSDKMKIAIDAFKELLTEMPKAEKQFALSKESVLNNMRSQRIIKSDIFWTYMSWKKLGIDYDIRKPIFESIEKMNLEDVDKFFVENIKPAHYSILIVGKKDKIDFNYLKQFGEVKELSLEEVFGY